MNKPKLTTTQIDVDTREKLRAIAERERRSMYDQLVVIIEEKFNQLPVKDAEKQSAPPQR